MIAPARQLALWVAAPALGLVLVFALQLGVLAVGVYAVWLLLLAARLMTALWTKQLRVEREVKADTIEIGGRVEVVVKLYNPAPWPIFWLYIEERLPKDLARTGTTRRLMFIPAGRRFYLTYQVRPTRRGCHQLGPLVMESGDLFGLFKRSRVHPRRDFVTALPEYEVVEEFQVGRQRRLGDRANRRSLFEDPTSIRGIREYRRGDAINRIHWRTSAHTGELQTRIYEHVVDAAATIVLDFHVGSYLDAPMPDPHNPPEEKAVRLACTLARYLHDGGWKVGLFTNGRDPLGLPGLTVTQARATETLREALEEAGRGVEDDRLQPVSIRASRRLEQFAVIRENLGRLAVSDGLPIEAVLPDELAYIERSQALIVITGRVTDGLVAAILEARELGYRVLMFVVENPQAHDRAFAQLVPADVEVFGMDADWRMREIAIGRWTL